MGPERRKCSRAAIIEALMASANGYEALTHALDKALGTSWDAELEPYRHAGEGSPLTLLTRVG